MTSVLPPTRLVDLLKRSSSKTLQKHSRDLAAAASAMTPEELETRFLRNHYLISPKALFLLADQQQLSSYFTFAVYKPPFCPMRRADAGANFHRVSVEGFIDAALRSREVFPVVSAALTPAEVRVRVLNDIDDYASGPVVVSLCDRHTFSTDLSGFVMSYDVLAAGHLPLRGVEPMDAALLFPPPSVALGAAENSDGGSKGKGEEPSSSSSSSPSPSPAAGEWAAKDAAHARRLQETECSYEVEKHVYYGPHAASLLRLRIASPPTPLPPRIGQYVRQHLHSYVLGDPEATAQLVKDSCEGRASRVAVLRGDIDFPRVFTHLRQVEFPAIPRAADGVGHAGAQEKQKQQQQQVVYHCNKCLEPMLRAERPHSFKHRTLKLLDGSWTPEAEYL